LEPPGQASVQAVEEPYVAPQYLLKGFGITGATEKALFAGEAEVALTGAVEGFFLKEGLAGTGALEGATVDLAMGLATGAFEGLRVTTGAVVEEATGDDDIQKVRPV